jgi:Family of unknown function (DUF5682)
VFGVRHLSPMGAVHLESFLSATDPTAVLVEGPSDASGLLAHLPASDTAPPVAILCFTHARPLRSLVLPLAAYSPEWAALTWAQRRGRVAKLIDLPAETWLSLQAAPVDATQSASSPSEGTTAEGDDPYETIARLSGEPDHETWWEKTFEHTTSAAAYQEATYALGVGLRGQGGETPAARRVLVLREAFMRREIKRTLAEGHAPSRVVVVCGAYHAPALEEDGLALDDDQVASLPRVPTVQTLIPYSYYRLSLKAGYGAGNGAPGYFQALWEEARRGTQGRLPARFLTQIAAELRQAGALRSSADVIDAVRLGGALAALGEGRSAPTLRDLRDAAITCLGHGDSAAITRAFDKVAIGHAVGSVPQGVLRTPLQEDFYRSIDSLRLSEYLKDSERVIHGATGKPWLDLREDHAGKRPADEGRDRRRSIFLHRLGALGIGFAADVTAASDRARSTYKEVWRARWTPACEIELVDNALRGDSIEEAASHRLAEQLAAATSVTEAAALARRAAACSLPGVLASTLAATARLTTDAEDLPAIAAAAVEIAELGRSEAARGESTGGLATLLEQLFLRAVMLAGAAARSGIDATPAVSRALAQLREVTRLAPAKTALDTARFLRALDAIADDDRSNPWVVGVACALLLEQGALPTATLERRLALRIGPGAEPARGAAFFEGLTSQNRFALLAIRPLWEAMSAFVDALDDDAFLRASVSLRRAFAAFEPGEVRQIVATLGEVWGSGGGAALSAALGAQVHTDELTALARALEGLDALDDLDDLDDLEDRDGLEDHDGLARVAGLDSLDGLADLGDLDS